ncbi:cell wall-binding repeat-containing protein [Planococcus shenhongbingii]|uniref:Cell wall-binding repeat-containing protein n=1 Tax=Planococcus shenhongbingii TaxID=3058398 RepID=A0ABT8NAZ6_9BACL|nr:cell wall-binding repeat-containing protein [Planococcus sp. N017]MDN7244715.1 cell wall-binding repeat-containing protein [Planococcus sp. N017]
MPKKIFTSVMAAALVLSLAGVQETPVEAAEGDFNLTIMHTNDTHANLDNVAKRVTLVNQVRATNPNNLLLDAGDVFSGTLYFNKYEGQADLPFMNLMKYDAMTFGNHEFDLGSSANGHLRLSQFVAGADFPFVAANVDFSGDANLAPLEKDGYTATAKNGEIYEGIIKEIDGEKVGIFGLTTEETATISSANEVAFTDYIAAAKEAVAGFKSQDVDKVIALTHIGYDDNANIDNDKALAAAVPDIDVIVGGHTHTELQKPVKAGNTVIVQAKQYNEFLGELDVTFNEAGVVTAFDGQLHKVADAAENEAAKNLLAPYKAEIEEMKNEEIGVVTDSPLNGARADVRTGETDLGNLITDGMLAAARKIDPDTSIALTNGGGIRESINAGPITLGEVLTVMPFGNSLAIMELTGKELRQALEISVKDYPLQSGGFLHFSGLTFNYDGKAPVGQRVSTVFTETAEGKVELDEAKTYKVATNTFTAKGGDGYTVFKEVYEDGRVSEPGIIDYEMFINYVRSLDSIDARDEDRINQVRLSGKDRYETAIAVSQEGWDTAETVVIAQGGHFADALTATPLAYKEEAPILLTRAAKLDERVKAEIARLGATNAIILGGTGAISPAVETELKAAGVESVRLGGKDRYETAAKVAEELGNAGQTAVVVNGTNFPDALSASSFAAVDEHPILLTRPDRIPAATAAALEGIEETIIVGGTGSVSEKVQGELPGAIRISGVDRYATSVAVAEEYFPEAKVGFAANGAGFADALAGSNLAANHEAPMLLVRQNSASKAVDDLAANYETIYTTGGTGAVSPAVIKELHKR